MRAGSSGASPCSRHPSSVMAVVQDSVEPIRSVLDERHESLSAKWSNFGGWRMPLEYAAGGVTAEHTAVRDGVGIFDVSHLGTAVVRGPGAIDGLNAVLTNDLQRIAAGRAQYSLLCANDGGVIDDLIVYVMSADEALIIPNAANAAEVLRLLRAQLPAGVEVEDLHQERAIIAVQGPLSPQVLAAMDLPHEMAYMAWARSGDMLVCRTGYTGEVGFEIVLPRQDAPALWDRLLSVDLGQGQRPVPCGLAARDTLRTEMGYPLHGQDISPQISPVEAGLSWAIGWNKPTFVGRSALIQQRDDGPRRHLVGLLAVERAIPRHAMTVLDNADSTIGVVTSGTFSPTLQRGIALALVTSETSVGDQVRVDVRGRHLAFEVVMPPFVSASPR